MADVSQLLKKVSRQKLQQGRWLELGAPRAYRWVTVVACKNHNQPVKPQRRGLTKAPNNGVPLTLINK